jgi:hypothetical protein
VRVRIPSARLAEEAEEEMSAGRLLAYIIYFGILGTELYIAGYEAIIGKYFFTEREFYPCLIGGLVIAWLWHWAFLKKRPHQP